MVLLLVVSFNIADLAVGMVAAANACLLTANGEAIYYKQIKKIDTKIKVVFTTSSRINCEEEQEVT